MEAKNVFVDLVDHLVESRDVTGLKKMRDLNVNFIINSVTIKDISLIELNEYIDEAVVMLEDKKDAVDILSLPLRKLIDQP